MSDNNVPMSLEGLQQAFMSIQERLEASHTQNARLIEQWNQQQAAILAQNQSALDIHRQQELAERKALAKILLKNLTKYDGHKDANKLEKFISSFLAYAEADQLSPDATVKGMVAYFTGDAAEWWTNFQPREFETLKEQVTDENTVLTLFLIVLRRRFTPIRHHATLRAQLHDSNTSRGLLQYVNRMRRLVREIGDVSDDKLMGCINHRIDGKQEMHLRSMGITEGLAALEELEVYAYANESKAKHDKHKKGTNTNKPYNHNKGSDRLASDHPNYMDVDTIKLRDQDARKSKAAKYEHIAVTAANYNNYDIIPLMTDKLRDYLRLNKGCFYCRQLNANHGSRYCPKKRSPKN